MQNDEKPLQIRTRLKIISGLPNCIPYLSVFFLMLIFFMLGSSFVQVSGIPVNLPEAQTRGSYGVKKHVVTVSKNGKIYFNDMEFSHLDRFKNRLMEISDKASSEKPAIILRADSDASFGTVAKIMSLAEALQINVFILTAAPRQEQTTRRDPTVE